MLACSISFLKKDSKAGMTANVPLLINNALQNYTAFILSLQRVITLWQNIKLLNACAVVLERTSMSTPGDLIAKRLTSSPAWRPMIPRDFKQQLWLVAASQRGLTAPTLHRLTRRALRTFPLVWSRRRGRSPRANPPTEAQGMGLPPYGL